MDFSRVKYILAFMSVTVMLVGAWYIAGKLVDFGESSKSKLIESAKSKTPDSGVDLEEEKEFVEETSRDGYSKVEKLFSSSELDERQKKFLGGSYNKYREVLEDIESNYEQEFSSIPNPEGETWEEGYEVIEKSSLNPFDRSTLESGVRMYSEQMMTIVGLYGTHCVVYKYGLGYEDNSNLIAVDYTNAMISEDSRELFGFGQVKTLFIDPKYSKLVERDGYSILYVKEF